MAEASTKVGLDERARDLIAHGDQLFSDRLPLLSLFQEIADHMYPERADFTVLRPMGLDFASILSTSFPVLCRRDLGNIFGSMLRPSDKEWAHASILRDDKLDDQGKKWLEHSNAIQRRAMYDPASQFVRATKEGDNDFSAFGQCVLSAEMARSRDRLLYRDWHLRDVVWSEDVDGAIGHVHRKWKPSYRDAVSLFRNSPHATLHPKMIEMGTDSKKKWTKCEIRHIRVPMEDWEPPTGKRNPDMPWVLKFIDVDNQHIIEEVPTHNRYYIIPRWLTVSGFQYAYSPAAVAALPDARLIQAMTLTMQEMGEKAVSPPMVTPGDVIRSDVNIFAGGITTYDAEYDERLGEVLRPINMGNQGGFNFGMELRNDVKEMIKEAFYLNKIALPQIGKEMTAFEVGQRVTEYVRQALPLFEPMETEYNGALCEATFDLMFRNGAFGSYKDIPQSVRGQDIQFKFESPLHSLLEQQKVSAFQNSRALIAEAMAVDHGAVNILDWRKALRDALEGGGTPAGWMRSDGAMVDLDKLAAQQAQMQQVLQTMSSGADVAKKIGDAGQSLQGIPGGARAQVGQQGI